MDWNKTIQDLVDQDQQNQEVSKTSFEDVLNNPQTGIVDEDVLKNKTIENVELGKDNITLYFTDGTEVAIKDFSKIEYTGILEYDM